MKIIRNFLNKKLGYMESKVSENEIDNLVENFKEEALEIYMSNNII
ncbi:hypothetical protein [Marinitoga aeolica]|uniref:Uncharacterized protein n=1 Tax=Marinitoga aeolica TaxID=2809031 RepID=A0ABY8PNC1_9BACT|nr:hypothetical protein [Marinitoga aeolica]WGS64143.1 hypothetical protein JRV97_07100 [Marinitoga aeolica]